MAKQKKFAPPAPPDALEVARAKDVLARAERQTAEERRQKLLDQLREVRAELRTARPQLAVIASRVRTLRAEGQNLDRAIRVRQERISELYASKPAVAEFLPNDPEVMQWQAALDSCESEIAQLRAQGESLPNLYQLQLKGVELQQCITGLEYAETNILNALSGVSGKSWAGKLVTGGVSTAF